MKASLVIIAFIAYFVLLLSLWSIIGGQVLLAKVDAALVKALGYLGEE